MNDPSILYWKWDDSHIESEKYFSEIDDIVERSSFDTIYVTTHWCHEGITSPKMHNAIQKACDFIHTKGRKMVFEIDFRAEKSVFVKQFPNQRLGFIYWKELIIDSDGSANTLFNIESGVGGELFLGNKQSGEDLLRVYSYIKSKEGYLPDTLCDITTDCDLLRKNSQDVELKIQSGASKCKNVFAIAVSWFDFNDVFSKENDDFFYDLLKYYSTIPLEGIALDEMGYPWHVSFDFSPSTYSVWNNSPYFSWSMQEKYTKQYGRDLLLDYLNRYIGSSDDSKEQIKSINYYFEFIRSEIVRVETFFYDSVKGLFGENSFVGVHPTWYAIEETQNTPEVWKNGINWWEVPRDYGFTDEIMIYPVRLALAHKANSNIFYNMWYSEATLCIDTFISEIYRNVRYGGRTISLSYECINEIGIVMQLKDPGLLEKVSEAEDAISLINSFQKSSAASDILVIMGIPAACNFLVNKDGKGEWNAHKNRFKDSFEIARNIWESGYNCDLVGSYEIDNGNVYVNESDCIIYGNQNYNYVIIVNPEFCKSSILSFIERIRLTDKGITVIGDMKYDFDGNDVKSLFKSIITGIDFYHSTPETSDLLYLFDLFKIRTNRVQYGSILQDGSIILTAPSPVLASGNYFECVFTHLESKIEIKANDLVGIKIDSKGNIERLVAPGLIELRINEHPIYQFPKPQIIQTGV